MKTVVIVLLMVRLLGRRCNGKELSPAAIDALRSATSTTPHTSLLEQISLALYDQECFGNNPPINELEECSDRIWSASGIFEATVIPYWNNPNIVRLLTCACDTCAVQTLIDYSFCPLLWSGFTTRPVLQLHCRGHHGAGDLGQHICGDFRRRQCN